MMWTNIVNILGARTVCDDPFLYPGAIKATILSLLLAKIKTELGLPALSSVGYYDIKLRNLVNTYES